MQTFSALDAKNRFGQLLDAAQRQPVIVTKQGCPSVVMMSIQGYEEQEQQRKKMAWQALSQIMDETRVYAASQGMTEEIMQELLKDES